MCKMTKLGQVGFLLLSIFAIKPAYCVRAKVVKPSSKKTMVERALLYDTNGNPISDDTVRSLTTIESEALASLARTEGYEGVARIFKNITMDYATTASGYAARALAANLRTLEYKDDSADAAAQAHQSMLDAASYETLAGISSVDSASYETASLVSKIDAASYETLAGVSSVNAGSYEIASLNSMNNGASYETASLNSRLNGASYETASLVSKNDAASYETLAGISAAHAGSYETASLNSMNHGASYETASLVSKNDAASYETLTGISSVHAASYETAAGIAALGASGSLYSVSGAVYNALLAVESLATGVAITYADASNSAANAASYETASLNSMNNGASYESASLNSMNHGASYETLAGISAAHAGSYETASLNSMNHGASYETLAGTSAAHAGSYETASLNSMNHGASYETALLNSMNHGASYETLAGISSVDAASYAALAGSSSSDASYQAGLVEASAADAASYEALALSSLITITGYQADVFNAVTAAENAINLASTTMLYAADTAIFNVISLNAAPLIVLKAGARAIESIGTSISNLANNGITTKQNLILATSVISDASLGLTALAAATNADASSISAAVDAESSLAVALYDITGATNADSVCLMSVANSLGSLSDSMFDLVTAEVNDAISLKDIADGYSLLAVAMQNLGLNSNAGADACETVIAYAYEIAIMSKDAILQSESANATLLAPVATLSSEVAVAMQAVALNRQFAQAGNFVHLRNCLLRTLKSAMATLNVAANSSLLVNQSDINTIGDSALASRNVIDLLVAAWEFGVGDAHQNAGITTQDGLVTTALANFSADGGATIDNLKALSSALVAYAEALGVAVEIV